MKFFDVINYKQILKVGGALPITILLIVLVSFVPMIQGLQQQPAFPKAWNGIFDVVTMGLLYGYKYYPFVVIVGAVLLIFAIFRYGAISLSDDGQITLINRITRRVSASFNVSEILEVRLNTNTIVDDNRDDIDKITFVTSKGTYTVYMPYYAAFELKNALPATVPIRNVEYKHTKTVYWVIFSLFVLLMLGLVVFNANVFKL